MADEYWGWGVKKFTPEEQAAYDKQWAAASSGNQIAGSGSISETDEGYYSGPMGQQQSAASNQPAVEMTPAEPQPSTHYLADPQNFAAVWSKYDQDPNYQDEHYTREQVDSLYDWYTIKNPGKTMDQWGPLMDNDEFVTGEMDRNKWWEPSQQTEASVQQSGTGVQIGDQVYDPTDPAKQAMMQQKELGDWNDLDWIGKLTAAISVTDQGLGNMPSWAEKVTQPAAKALSSAMAGPATLKIAGSAAALLGGTGAAAVLANPYVLAGAALVTGGLTFYQAVTKKEIPVFNKFLELSDLMDTITEHTLGFGAQAIEVGKQNIKAAREDPDDAYGLMAAINDSIKYVGEHASSMWDTGEYFYEMQGSVGDFAIDALKEIFKGEEGTKVGEAWFFNRGINEKQQLAEGTYGAEGMTNLREIDEELKAMGVDKDLRQSLIQQWVINASGSSGNVSDYVAQSLIDVGILTTPMENEAAGALSKITGNDIGVQATQINRGSIATQLPFVGNIIQAVRNSQGKGESKAPGGIMEWFDTYKNLTRSADVNTLTDADRFFGGITADGKIKEFARTEKTGLADMLPESKVAGVGNIANNVMNAYMYDVKDTTDLRNRLADLAGSTQQSAASEALGGFTNSAEVNTVRDGIRHAINTTNPEILIRQYDDSGQARATLAQAAQDLGMEVKDLLSLYSETPAVFEQRARDYAAQHNGMFAGLDVSQGVDPISTIIQGFSTAKEGKGAPMAWDIRQLQYQVTTSLIDSMAEYYTDYYGVKPNSAINTLFDTMKSAQSLLLLGWSPSYFINNVINNAVTSAAEGVLGFMTPKQIKQFIDAFGTAPARFDVDTNAEFRGQTVTGKGGLEAFTSAAAEAKKANDSAVNKGLKEINGLLRKANDKLGAFSRLSGLMETLQGNQLTAVAIQQYWGRRWKRGEGFHLMPDALVEAIESQNPGMTNVIYQAIENGLNMEQIGKALYGTYIKPDAGTVMKQVCDNLFRGEAAVYEEVLEKSGVTREINERFKNCKTDEERAAVMEDVRQKLNDYVENLRREDLIERANQVAVEAEASGLAPVAQIMSEMEMNHTEFWIRQRQAWTDAYNKMLDEGMDSAARRSLLADLVAKQQKDWADLYKQEAATATGVMQGLGFQNESHARYIGLMNEKNQNWQNFNDAKSRELARAYERTNALYAAAEGKNGKRGSKVDKTQLNEVWEDFHRNTAELYDQHFAREQELQAKMDAAFVEGYEFSTQKSGEQLRQNFQRVAEIRKRMHDMQKDAHEKTQKMGPEDKKAYYEEFNPKYNALIREIGNLGDANARIVEETDGQTYENRATVNMTPEQTIQAEHVKEVNDAAREQAMRERQGYLDRDGIRQDWIEAGRTPAEADLMMQVFDAAAEAWAKQNGMYPDEFYSEALRLKGIARWLGEAPQEALHQTFEEFAEDNADMMPDVTKRTLDAIKKKGTVTIYSNMPIEDGVDVTISRQEIEYSVGRNGKIYSRTVPIEQVAWGESPYIGGYYMSPTAEQVGNRTIASRISKMSVEQMMNSRFGDYIRSHFGNPNFREWFGESKITDEYGLPLVVHHGTPGETFAVFDPAMMGSNTNAYSAGMGFFFAGTDETAAFYAHGDYDNIMDVYLRIENPFIYDYEGAKYREESYAEIIQHAKDAGHDGVILKNTYDSEPKDNIYIVFSNDQIKSIENDGTFNKLDPNILHQDAQAIVKGQFEAADFGNVIRMLQASDVSTMVHESGHLFRRTLSTPLLQEFTQWAGFEDVGEFQDLEQRFWKNDPTLSEADRNRYEDAEEKFARGFEQYLMDGSAPTPGLKAVFKSFRDYLLDIYQKVKATVTGNDYSKEESFIFHGKTGDEVLNINAEINGVKLRDIFDRMLTDDVQRMPGYEELISKHRQELAADRHNMRMSDKALSRRAQVEVTKQILREFGGMDAAEAALQNYDLPMEIAGMRVDDATLHQAIQAAKVDPQMNPFASADRHELKGTQTYGYSITDANSGKKYQMQYKVVELNDLVPSNLWFGDQLVINEEYPGDVQARDRSANQADVWSHAANLNPGLLIDEQRAIDSGAPIVGEGNMYVESGNGRVLSLMKAQQDFPEQWAAYQEYLKNSVGDYGIDPDQLESFENPVLIRERLGGDAAAFAEDANSNRNKVMTASENALTDANKVNYVTLSNLDIIPGEGVDTFTTEKNAQAAVEWLRSLPESERARYSTTNRNGDLILSADGETRFINALFATLYATPESMDIIRSFSETADSDIRAVESALKQTLPEMARAEGLIRSGSRAESLSITADVMAAAGLLQDARKAGMNIHDYLAQSVIPGMERWTPTQALLAGFFGDAKNNVRMLRDFFNAYGEEVYKAGDPNQLSLFGESKTREQMINDSLDAAINKKMAAGSSQQTEASSQQAAGSPALNQSVLDSTEKWSSEFAKVLDENLQRTFDDGMAVKLEDADGVYLTGETNVKYETMVQRWVRDFSNDRNMSSDQYLYAWAYLEWWVKGSEGEEPQGNPIWEADVKKAIMQDFAEEHSDMISELKRRYQKGAEVDPGSVPNNGDYVKRVYSFDHGFWEIAGNVYRDGKLVAYLPAELAKMQRTIDVDGETFRVLGVDLQNPEGLVYFDPLLEITRTVIAGKPEGFDEPRNAFAFMRPAKQDGVPMSMPVADAYSEIKTKYLDPALDAFMDAYKEADTDARTKKMSGLDLQTRAQLEQWLDQDVAEDMRVEKYRAMKYSDTKKDAAMLNYNQRYGFDPILTVLNPYQFWYTRSMWKWAKRMIDKPSLNNAYERMLEYEDKNRQENLPSRLSGKWRVPMAYLSKWMGGSYYFDPLSQLFPFAQFGQSYSSNMNEATLKARTEAILNEQCDNNLISVEEMQQALNDKKGAIWENAYTQAELEVGKEDGLSTLASQFISPNIFVSWYSKKQAGEDPGTLSGTRTGNAIKALTSDIPLVSKLGSIVGDAMTLPERALRKLYGYDYNEFGQYGDQQIRKQISQMCADGEITWRQALNAMNEKQGTIWDMAADRQRKEAMYKVPGFAGAQAVKDLVSGNANIGDTLSTMAVSAIGGGSIYPTGEQTLREKKAARDQAYIDKANGDAEAVNRWYDENEDYVVRTATYIDDPEELLKYTLYQNINTTYYAQPYAQQQEIKNQLGPEFERALITKETRNYKAVPFEKLAEWNAALGGTNPSVGSIDVHGVQQVMQLSNKVIDAVAEHDELKNQLYPGIGVIQDKYYELPKDQRKAFIAQFPRLQEYWDWNREYKNEHPEYVQWEEGRSDYYNEKTLYNSYADMTEYTQKQLDYAKATGKDLSDAAQYELQKLYLKYANPSFMSFEDYVKQLQDWE